MGECHGIGHIRRGTLADNGASVGGVTRRPCLNLNDIPGKAFCILNKEVCLLYRIIVLHVLNNRMPWSFDNSIMPSDSNVIWWFFKQKYSGETFLRPGVMLVN